MEKTDLLSKYLFDIHNKQLTPFYDGDNSTVWQDLDEKSADQNSVDKTLFRAIAKDIIVKLKADNDFATQLPQVLYEVHSSSLPPYYISLQDYTNYHNDKEDDRSQNNWTTLEENSANIEQVDKQFFRNIAKFILDTIIADT